MGKGFEKVNRSVVRMASQLYTNRTHILILEVHSA